MNYCEGLFENLPSKSSLKKAFKKGEIHINNAEAKSGYWVKEGDLLQLLDLEKNLPKTYKMSVPILYEDDFIAVVDKPAGISVSGNQFRTLENAVASIILPSDQPDSLKRARAAHRLDAPTSGIVLFAKTAQSRIELGRMFEEQEIKKTYHAIVVGTPSSQIIDDPIGEKEASSELQHEKSFHSLRTKSMSLVKLMPSTGRTHQLRIHMEKIGCPIVGDSLYGKDVGIRHKGLFLAASQVSFKHPITKKKMNIVCPIPHKFHSLIHRETRRWQSHQQKRPAQEGAGQ